VFKANYVGSSPILRVRFSQRDSEDQQSWTIWTHSIYDYLCKSTEWCSLINYKYLCAVFQKYYVSSCSDVETAYRQIQDYETFISLAFKSICEYWRRKLRSMEKKTTGFWRIWTFDFEYIHIQQITHCDSWIWAASNITIYKYSSKS
jgi:hypothetical protein